MIFNYVIGGFIYFLILASMLVGSLVLDSEDSIKEENDWLSELKKYILPGVIIHGVAFVLNGTLVNVDNWTTTLQEPILFFAAFLYLLWIKKGEKIDFVFYCTVVAILVANVVGQVLAVFIVVFHIVFVEKYVLLYFLLLTGAALLLYFGIKKMGLWNLQVFNSHLDTGMRRILTFVILVFFFIFSNYQFLFFLMETKPTEPSLMITVFRLLLSLFCLLILILYDSMESRFVAEREKDFMEQMWYRQQEQYRMSKESIDVINRKCHDLKYQIAALQNIQESGERNRQIKEMEKSIDIYDSVLKTGNPVLDTVLTEKSLFCENHEIRLTVMADGGSLLFVNSVDLYSMLGNALDNAIESVMDVEDKEKRLIRLSVFREKSMEIIRIRNYYQKDIEFHDGLPVTTKKNTNGYHGYGIKSIRHTARMYGGECLCDAKDHIFVLQILLPASKEPIEYDN